MRRREFVTLLGGAAAAWPLPARAQQGERMRRIGILSGLANDDEGQSRIAAFKRGLATLGWTEDRNIQIVERWAVGETERVRSYTAEIVGLSADVIVAIGSRAWVAVQQETRTIPVVAIGAPFSWFESLARPGGNVTGFGIFETSIIGKLLDLLHEAVPLVTRVVMLVHADNPSVVDYSRELERATLLAIKPTVVQVRKRDDIERALDEFARDPSGSLLVPPEVFVSANREFVLVLAARHRLPVVSPYRLFVTGGGLMSYGPDFPDVYRRAAGYVDRILKGEKPANLPIQLPTKYDLVINLKTAKALGLDVPPNLLARADEVIE
jgi:putative tryptophan/tyrosine transport system substrate-binding protein